jgi:WD40 repeat protein
MLVGIGSSGGKVTIWNPDSADEGNREWRATPHPIQSLGFSPDGTKVVVGGRGFCSLWDVSTTSSEPAQIFSADIGPGETVMSTKFNDAGNRLLLACVDRVVLLDASTGAALSSTQHSSPQKCYNALFCFNDTRIFGSVSRDTLVVWDVETAKEMTAYYDLTGDVGVVQFMDVLANGHIAATGSHTGEISVWDLLGQNCTQTLKGHERAISALRFLSDGQSLFSSCDEYTAILWNFHSGDVVRQFDFRSIGEVMAFDAVTSRIFLKGGNAFATQVVVLLLTEDMQVDTEHPVAKKSTNILCSFSAFARQTVLM